MGSGERRPAEQSSRLASRLGDLWVFWPAFLSWATVTACVAGSRFRVWGALPEWASDVLGWTALGFVVAAAVGAVVVTVRFRIARHWFAVLVNLSTALVAYVAVSFAVVVHDANDGVARAEERLQQTQVRIDAIVRPRSNKR